MPNTTTQALELLGAVQGRALMTTGSIARRLGVPMWAIRRLFERGILPPADRIGAYRVVAEADLPKAA